MTVRLIKVSVSNFRSCKATEAYLRPYTALVGYNNAGKSNIILAIKWLLDGSQLSDADMYDPRKPVRVEGVIEGITDDTLTLLSQENQQKITPFILGKTLRFARKQEVEFVEGEKVKVKKTLEVFDGTTWKKIQVGLMGQFQIYFLNRFIFLQCLMQSKMQPKINQVQQSQKF